MGTILNVRGNVNDQSWSAEIKSDNGYVVTTMVGGEGCFYHRLISWTPDYVIYEYGNSPNSVTRVKWTPDGNRTILV